MIGRKTFISSVVAAFSNQFDTLRPHVGVSIGVVFSIFGLLVLIGRYIQQEKDFFIHILQEYGVVEDVIIAGIVWQSSMQQTYSDFAVSAREMWSNLHWYTRLQRGWCRSMVR